MVKGNNPSLSLLLCIGCILSDTTRARSMFVASIIIRIIMLTELAQLHLPSRPQTSFILDYPVSYL